MKKTNKLFKLTITALLALPILTGCSSQTLKTVDNLDVEYGTPISTDVAQYLSEDIDKARASISYIALQNGILPSTLYCLYVIFLENK